MNLQKRTAEGENQVIGNKRGPRGEPPGSRFLNFRPLFIIVAGIILGQAILYGPCLIGRKILLPLDVLAQPAVYLPQTPETAKIVPHDVMLLDLIYQFEPARRFAATELQHGRFPVWAPYQYGGVPFVWPKFSPFLFLESCSASPVMLAWVQLFASLVAGVGMFVFCRRTLGVGFWPAAVCAWCYPLTTFFALWQGFPTGLAVYWLPWIFLMVDGTIRGSNPTAAIGLSAVTLLALISGHLDVAGQVLLGSGIFALWCLWDAHRGEEWGKRARSAVARLALGWGLGFLLAAPHILPLLGYAQTGSRMLHRSEGAEERPPAGLVALPQAVLPDLYGAVATGSLYIIPTTSATNLQESAAGAYAGVLAALLVAPLAWCSRRHRALNSFWAFLVLFGLSWCLGIPGFEDLLRLPGLNLMSHNRLVFLTAFAVLALAAIGLENLLNGAVTRRWWFGLPAALLAGLGGWCLYRSRVLPEPIATRLGQAVLNGQSMSWWIKDLDGVHQVQAWFALHYAVMAIFCGLAFAGWLWIWVDQSGRFRLVPVLAFLLVADLLWFDHDRSAQCDPALYFPKIPVLEQVAHSVPGRVLGVNCLPASVTAMQGLNDILGYDSIDPARMVDLLRTTDMHGSEPPYAAVQFLTPKGNFIPPCGVRLPPVLDLLNVRYVIFRGTPPPTFEPAFARDDYWVLINSNALPRAFVPRSVTTAAGDDEALAGLTSPQFHPADVAFVPSPIVLPQTCRGTAEITNEIPSRVTLTVRMETPGLVVLADNWDPGWRAYWNGKPVPVLRADYTVRGVVLPAGSGTLEFVYQPVSLKLGLWLAGFAGVGLLGWLAAIRMPRTKIKKPSTGS